MFIEYKSSSCGVLRLTPCPVFQKIMIDSMSCQECRFFKRNHKFDVIECSAAEDIAAAFEDMDHYKRKATP